MISIKSVNYCVVEQTLVDSYGASRALAKEMIRQGCVQSINKGSLIYIEGSSTETVTFLIDGLLGFHHTDSRDSGLFHNVIYPGIPLNEIQFFLGGTSPLDIRTATQCCVLTLTFRRVDKLMSNSLEFNQMLSYSMARKHKVMSELFYLGSERQPHKKIYRALEILSNLNRHLIANVNILALASLLNMSRNTVGASIRDLLAKQAIEKVSSGYKVVAHFDREKIKPSNRPPLITNQHTNYCGTTKYLNQ